VDAADFVGAIEIGQRARHAQHAMIAEGRIAAAAARNSDNPLPSGRATPLSTAMDTERLISRAGSAPPKSSEALWSRRRCTKTSCGLEIGTQTVLSRNSTAPVLN